MDDAGARYPLEIDPIVQLAKLTASDGATGDRLGFSVAMSGDTVVAGAPLDNVGSNNNQGSVYVFQKPAGGWQNATETAGQADRLRRRRERPSGHRGGGRGRHSGAGATLDDGGTRSARARTRAILAVEHFVTPPGSWLPGQAALSTRGRRSLRSLRARLITVAAVVCAALQHRGGDATPTVVGHGDSRPIAANATASGRARNRRVEVTITHRRACL